MTSETQAAVPESPAQPPAERPAEPSDAADRAAQLLDSLEERPLAEHPDAYAQIHRDLSDALASIDDA